MNETTLFIRFGVALAVGILVGIQREFSQDKDMQRELAAGVRTFALLGLVGCAAAMSSSLLHSAWPLFGTVVVVGAYFTVNYLVDASTGRTGLTTKVSALFTVLIGALAFHGHLTVAIALAVVMTLLLSTKVELHEFVRHLTRADVYATLKFAVIAAIILPVLPNRTFGPPPFDVLNPLKIWLLVVFISAIGFVGYVLMKSVGSRRGIGLTGLLGGLVSSTAVTLSFSQRSKDAPELSRSFAMAIVVSWTVMFFRILTVVSVVNISLLHRIAVPVAVPAIVGILYAVYLFLGRRHDGTGHEVLLDNPFRLGPAIKFGLVFTAVLLAAKAAQIYLGTRGVYLSSFLSGLFDVDAIVISVARFSSNGTSLPLTAAAWSVVIASSANTLVKGLFAFFGGAPQLRSHILPAMAIMLLSSLAAAVVWLRVVG